MTYQNQVSPTFRNIDVTPTVAQAIKAANERAMLCKPFVMPPAPAVMQIPLRNKGYCEILAGRFTHTPIRIAEQPIDGAVGDGAVDYILKLTAKKAVGKGISFNNNGQWAKQKLPESGEYVAQVCHVPDGSALLAIIRELTSEQCILLGAPPGVTDGEQFTILSAKKLCKRLGVPLEDENKPEKPLGVYHDGQTGELLVGRFSENLIKSTWILIDIDSDPAMPPDWLAWSMDQWIDAVDGVAPELGFARAEKVISPSTSNRVVDAAGRPVMVQTDGGIRAHIFAQMPVGARARWLDVLKDRCFLADRFYTKPPKSDKAKPAAKAFIDIAVAKSSSRLSFEGPPVLGAEALQAGAVIAPHGGRIVGVPGVRLAVEALHIDPAAQAELRQAQARKRGTRLTRTGNNGGERWVEELPDALGFDFLLDSEVGLLTIRQAYDCNYSRLRCQASWRGSTSDNAIYFRGGPDGPYVFDNGENLRLLVNRDEFIEHVFGQRARIEAQQAAGVLPAPAPGHAAGLPPALPAPAPGLDTGLPPALPAPAPGLDTGPTPGLDAGAALTPPEPPPLLRPLAQYSFADLEKRAVEIPPVSDESTRKMMRELLFDAAASPTLGPAELDDLLGALTGPWKLATLKQELKDAQKAVNRHNSQFQAQTANEAACRSVPKGYKRFRLISLDKAAWSRTDANGAPIQITENFNEIFDIHGATASFNEMSQRVELGGSLSNFSLDAGVRRLQDACIYNFLPVRAADVSAMLKMIALGNSRHPFREFLDQQAGQWDGTDRLRGPGGLLATLKLAEGMDPAVVEAGVSAWLYGVIACARHLFRGRPGDEPRVCLVLCGPQSEGKTTWFARLFNGLFEESERCFRGGHLLDDGKDAKIAASRYLVCELGEIDGTLRKADLGKLKAFLSASEDVIRRPYGLEDEIFERRTLFCGTVNETEFLVDTTGNSRFFSVGIDAIDLDAQRRIDMSSLWMQLDQELKQRLESRGRNPEYEPLPWHLSRDLLMQSEAQNEARRKVGHVEQLIRELFDWDDERWCRFAGLGWTVDRMREVSPLRIADVVSALDQVSARAIDASEVGRVVRRLTGVRKGFATTITRQHERVKGKYYPLPPLASQRRELSQQTVEKVFQQKGDM